VRAPGNEAELVGAAAAGDPAAVAALWDAYGPRLFAFCHRLLGDPHAAADAAQDAFLLVQPQLGRLQREEIGVGDALFRAARTTSYELLSRAPRDEPRAGVSLSAAAARLRPQQRAALALAGLERMSYRDIATVLDTSVESVPALLARARLRLLDELRGTALAAAAARTSACEEALPLLGAAADGEPQGADTAWAESHAAACETCPRSRRAMQEATATYAAWSPAAPPSWLRGATLAELGADGAEASAAAPDPDSDSDLAAPAAAAWFTPRPNLSAALMGSTLLIVAFGTLIAATIGPLRQGAPVLGGIELPASSPTVTVAATPPPAAPARAPGAPGRRGARSPRRSPSSTVSRVELVRSVGTAPAPVVRRPTAPRAPPARPAPRQQRRPTGRRPSRKPTTPAPAPAAPAPTGAGDATPGAGSPEAPTTATAASTSSAPPAAGSPGSPTQPPPSATPPPVPIKHESGDDDDGDDDDHGDDAGHRQRGKGPGPPPCGDRDGDRDDDGWHDGDDD
jgi:DNA-directed RNA polymerase specialized sigma24 family protein